MNQIKIIVSGAFKEKALLTSILGDKLEEEGIDVAFQDTLADSLVRSRHEDLVSEFKQTNDALVTLVVENLINTNVIEDIKALLTEFKDPNWKSTNDAWNSAIKTVDERLRQILQI